MRDRRQCVKAALGVGVLVGAFAVYVLLFDRASCAGAFKLMSVKVRFEYFWSTLVMIAHRPVFGFGPGTFGNVFARFKLFGGEETQFAHNNYLQVFAESGIFAGIGFGLFFAIVWLRGFYIMKQKTGRSFDEAVRVGAFLGLTGFLLHGLIDFDLYVPGAALNAFVLAAFIFQDEGRKAVISTRGWGRKIVPLIAAAGIAGTCAALYPGRLQAARHFKEGMADFQKGFYAKALSAFTTASRLDRSNPLYRYQAGMCHDRMRSPQEAIPYFKKAAALNRASSRFHYELAKSYFQAGGYEQIVELELKKAVAWYPNSAFYRNELAKYFEIVGQKEKALLEYHAIRRIHPSHEEAGRKISSFESDAARPDKE
jgi:hypothetical protein